MVDAVEALGVNAIQLTHSSGEIAVRGFGKKVIVVAHLTVGMDNPVEAFAYEVIQGAGKLNS